MKKSQEQQGVSGDGDNQDGSQTSPGPKPERLNINRQDWKEALRRALEKVRPPEGWPDKDEDDGGEDATR